jgi:CrcB protein
MNLAQVMFVFLGGGLGSLLRFFVSRFFNVLLAFNLPLATFSSNILSIVIMLLAYYFAELKPQSAESVKFFILIGFCGGLSTFSTFSFETAELFRRGELYWAVSNIILNNLLCIGAAYFFYSRVSN